MTLSDDGWAAMLDGPGMAPAAKQISLHSDDPGDTGAHEIAGGAPAYHRLVPTWGVAALKALPLGATLVFDCADVDIKFAGLWAEDGTTFLGGVPITNETKVGQGTYSLDTLVVTGGIPPSSTPVEMPDPLFHLDATALALADNAAVPSWDGGNGFDFPQNGGTDGVYHAAVAAINNKAMVELPNAGTNFELSPWAPGPNGDQFGSFYFVMKAGDEAANGNSSATPFYCTTNAAHDPGVYTSFSIDFDLADATHALGRLHVGAYDQWDGGWFEVYTERVIPPVGAQDSGISDFHLFEVHIETGQTPVVYIDGSAMALTDYAGAALAGNVPVCWFEALGADATGYIDILPYTSELAEMLVYSGAVALTAEQKAQARSDLLAKYGL